MQRFQRLPIKEKTALLAMLAACSAVFLTALDQTVVVTALPQMISDLSITLQQLDRAAWIVSGYLLGFIIAMPLMGRISDMYGRRNVFLICLGIFALGSLFCALAPNLGSSVDISFLQHIGINVASPANIGDPSTLSPGLVWLVAARFVQAAGGGAIIPVAMAIAGDFYGEKQRALALGLIGMVTETGGVLGPLYGAIIVQTWHWQAIFYLNVPIVAILGTLIWWLVPSRKGALNRVPTSQEDAIKQAPTNRGRIDLLGSLLLGASLACLSLGLSQEAITSSTGVVNSNQAPIQNNPWLIGASLLLLAAFIALELFIEAGTRFVEGDREGRKGRPSNDSSFTRKLFSRILPVVDMSAFKRVTFSASSLVSFLVGAALISAMVNIPFYIDTVVGGSALDSGLALLRLTAMIPIGAIIGGILCSRITCRVTAIIGLSLTALGFFLMHLWPINVYWVQITTSTVVTGFGFGLVIAPIGTTAINAVNNQQMGMASSTVTVLRMIGMIIGLAALTSWGLGRFHEIMLGFKAPAGTSISAYEAALQQYGINAGHEVYTSIFLMAGILCLVAIIPALLLEGKRPSPYVVLGKSYENVIP